MSHNVFISHFGEDESALDSLKERLKALGCEVRNSSVEKKKYRPYTVSDATIARYLRVCIRWAGTFIVLIGEHTHERPWVNYEIRSAYRQGKNIVGIYMQGCKDNVEIPAAFQLYGGPILGNGSLNKLADIIKGKCPPPEGPNGSERNVPLFPMQTVKC